MTRVFYLASNFHEFDPPKHAKVITAESSDYSFPENVTLGLRGTFWNVFEAVISPEVTPFEIELLGYKWTVDNLIVLDVREDRFPLVDGKQTRYVCLFEVHSDLPESKTIDTLSVEQKLSEQQFVKQLFTAIRSVDGYEWLSSLKHERGLPARFQEEFKGNIDLAETAAALAGFFFLGNLLLWQSQREHSNLDLSEAGRSYRRNVSKLLETRRKLINIERWILTKNISNDPQIKQFAREIKGSLGLVRKYDGLLPLNESIEGHYVSASTLRQERYTKRISTLATVFALIGIPISFLSMLLALSTTSPVVENGPSLFANIGVLRFLLIFGVPSLIVTFFIGVVVAIITHRR